MAQSAIKSIISLSVISGILGQCPLQQGTSFIDLTVLNIGIILLQFFYTYKIILQTAEFSTCLRSSILSKFLKDMNSFWYYYGMMPEIWHETCAKN